MKDLITVDEFKLYNGITKDDEDFKLQLLISAVSSLIKAYTNNNFVDNYDTPIFESFNLDYITDTIFLSQYPIRDILEVKETVITEQDSTVHPPLEEGNHFTRTEDGLVRLGPTNAWAASPSRVDVTYTAGYEDTPNDIKLAAIYLVNYYKKEDFKEVKSINGTSINTYSLDEADFPLHIKAILNFYNLK